MPAGGVVSYVEAGSIGSMVGILPGDEIRAVNGKIVRDIIDFKILTDEDKFTLEVKKDGKLSYVPVRNESRNPLGIFFHSSIFDFLKTCRNRCIFCFVDQLPSGLRRSLYLKDDDYRLSFLYGNFITLNNTEDRDIERIIGQRLTPLYLSLHSISEETRRFMMGYSNLKIYSYLEAFSDSGIDIHVQIVLCPGINDGIELETTLNELKNRYSCVKSVGIVPVGLTSYRKGLFSLRTCTLRETRDLAKQVFNWQKRCRKETGKNWVYLADEFYLTANLPLPESSYYDDFPQIENGIGLTRRFLDNFSKSATDFDPSRIIKRFSIATGRLIGKIIEISLGEAGIGNMVDVVTITNKFFGPQITVSGLLTGTDIISSKHMINNTLLISNALLNEDNLFLDSVSLEELRRELGQPVRIIAQDGSNLIKVLIDDD